MSLIRRNIKVDVVVVVIFVVLSLGKKLNVLCFLGCLLSGLQDSETFKLQFDFVL